MEKKKKEKVRSGKINPNNRQVSSIAANLPQDRNNDKNKNKSNFKKHLPQQNDDENDISKDIQSNNIFESDKPHNSRKQTKNGAKKKIKSKNNDNQRKINNQNKMLSPTNIILRSRNDISYQNNRIDLIDGFDFEENIKNDLDQNSSMDFSPIIKKEIRMSPPLTPYNNNIDFNIGKNLQNELDISDNFIDKELDSNTGNNSSFTQLFTSKCDLKAELQAAIQVNKQLKQRDYNLQKRIQDLNEQSQVALQVLEDRLTELRDENVRLLEYLEQLPSEERLIIEYNKLTTFPIEDDDIGPLINIGILEEGENVSVLKERLDDMITELRYYESKYDIVAQYGEDGFMTKFFLSYFDDSYSKKNSSNIPDEKPINDPNNEKLAKELKHKIDLLEKSSESSVKMARKKLIRLEKEVELLRKNVQDQQLITSYQPTESSSTILNQSGLFSLQDVKTVLVTAGGDKNNLKQINGNTFSYKSGNKNGKLKEIKFEVESICGRPYTLSSDSTRKVSLFTFFKSII